MKGKEKINMKIGIIGYGSMGKMLVDKFLAYKENLFEAIYVTNRTYEKIESLENECHVCKSCKEVAQATDIVFVCVRPVDIKSVLSDIAEVIDERTLLVSLNGSILFEQLESICKNGIAKVIPSVTAEVNQSQTLVCYNKWVKEEDKESLKQVLSVLGKVIELPEDEMGMGSELVSCMPGFMAAIMHEISQAARMHTDIPDEEIVQMVLNTMVGTGELMLKNKYSFEEVESRVATKGGITAVGTKIIHERFPEIAEAIFEDTLEKRKQTTQMAQKMFD